MTASPTTGESARGSPASNIRQRSSTRLGRAPGPAGRRRRGIERRAASTSTKQHSASKMASATGPGHLDQKRIARDELRRRRRGGSTTFARGERSSVEVPELDHLDGEASRGPQTARMQAGRLPTRQWAEPWRRLRRSRRLDCFVWRGSCCRGWSASARSITALALRSASVLRREESAPESAVASPP